MGRPPLKTTAPTVKTTVRLDQRTIDRIYGLSGPQGMAWFIRKAIAEALDRGEAECAAIDAARRDEGQQRG